MSDRHHFIGAYLHHDRQRAAIVRLSCVTDFAARTTEAKTFADQVAMTACAVGSNLGDILNVPTPGGFTVSERLTHITRALGEEVRIESAFVETAKR